MPADANKSQRGCLKEARGSSCDASPARICGRGRVRAAILVFCRRRSRALENRERAS